MLVRHRVVDPSVCVRAFAVRARDHRRLRLRVRVRDLCTAIVLRQVDVLRLPGFTLVPGRIRARRRRVGRAVQRNLALAAVTARQHHFHALGTDAVLIIVVVPHLDDLFLDRHRRVLVRQRGSDDRAVVGRDAARITQLVVRRQIHFDPLVLDLRLGDDTYPVVFRNREVVLGQVFKLLLCPVVVLREGHGLPGIQGLQRRAAHSLELHGQGDRTQSILVVVVVPDFDHAGRHLFGRMAVFDGIGTIFVQDNFLRVLGDVALIHGVLNLRRRDGAVGVDLDLVLRQIREAPGPIVLRSRRGGPFGRAVVGRQDDRHAVGTDLVVVVRVGPILDTTDLQELLRVGHGHGIGLFESVIARNHQHEHAVAHFGDVRVGGIVGFRRRVGEHVTGCRLSLVDLVFLPPVESADMDPAVLVSDQRGLRAVGIKDVDYLSVHRGLVELEQAVPLVAVGGRARREELFGVGILDCGILKRAVNLELDARETNRRIIVVLLDDDQVAVILDAEVLRLVHIV